MPPALVVLTLALLLGIQPVTTDLYLPALPALTTGFGAPVAQAQLTLTALLLAFGLSQLVLGPLSDRFGRRPVLLWGLAAYVLAAVGAALAPSMALLIGWRTLQGAAMGASVMAARAIVRDLYQPADGARVMSRALTGLGVIACLCAPIGGLVSDLAGWRVALLVPALFGAVALGLVAWRFDESLARRDPQALQPATLVRTWATVLRHPTFLAFCALTTASYALLFTFLAASSFVFIQVLGLTKTQYGLVMLWNSLSYIGGTFVCRYWLARHGVRRSVARGAVLTLSGGLLMAGLAFAGIHSTAAIVGPLTLMMLGHGVHQPCGQSGAVGPFPQAAGAASALNGFVMMLAVFGVGGWLGTHLDGTVLPLTYGMGFWSVCVALLAWTVVQKHG
ncbi:multidrug effflux MFS transporter [Variovorax arabinosiphilus]|uniref:multidrug effflux MFS transporter n=1 Tax=Variovorax arabinosiphilus TaxID=3053498 RepID=UPI00257845A0|nr:MULTISPECIES: multidrug effflux MFS transporter [unclassified Variovorax]MDM0119444.1 multidrug effflux MFS transporter [Variovorax sp. J2L1-78]MDM0129870.1 multidrug effflux MFS transporter [Variovorax sp. J2L1-63]MDM0232344.1 multidrug effflux MFS transporter [Variovorax sp. J2R1-6]